MSAVGHLLIPSWPMCVSLMLFSFELVTMITPFPQCILLLVIRTGDVVVTYTYLPRVGYVVKNVTRSVITQCTLTKD